jgi:DNA-binding NarL/FixJ family response regulator
LLGNSGDGLGFHGQQKQIEKMLQGLNILVVDDNAYMRRLTRTMLTNLGGRSVLEASDGLGALESIRTTDPDVMLLDPGHAGTQRHRGVAHRALPRGVSAPEPSGHHADGSGATRARE